MSAHGVSTRNRSQLPHEIVVYYAIHCHQDNMTGVIKRSRVSIHHDEDTVTIGYGKEAFTATILAKGTKMEVCRHLFEHEREIDIWSEDDETKAFIIEYYKQYCIEVETENGILT
jgi:hypothetical protein